MGTSLVIGRISGAAAGAIRVTSICRMIMYGPMSRICELVNNDHSLGVCATDHSVGQALCVPISMNPNI